MATPTGVPSPILRLYRQLTHRRIMTTAQRCPSALGGSLSHPPDGAEASQKRQLTGPDLQNGL